MGRLGERGGVRRLVALVACLALVACGAPGASTSSARGSSAGALPERGAPGGASAVPATTGEPAAPAPLRPPVRVRAMDARTIAHRGVYIALERGYFAEEGLEVELVPTSANPDTIAALVTGELDFSSGGPEPILFNAAARGVGVKIVAYNVQIGPGDLSSGFLVRKDLLDSGRYQGPQDFRGFTVALPANGGLQHMFLERLLGRGGLTLADVQTVVLPFPETLPAFANGAIEAAFVADPFASLAEAQGVAVQVAPMGDLYPGMPGNVLTISPVFAAREPEAARRYITAHLRGQRDYYRAIQRDEGGRDEILQILMKYMPLQDPRLYTRLLTSPVDPNMTLDPRPLEEIRDYYLKFGTLQQRVEVSQVLDRSYADYALQRLGRLP